MIYSIFPDKDTTIYQYTNGVSATNKNTGLDSILELEKTISAPTIEIITDITQSVSILTSANSRILIQFDLTELSQSISNGLISTSSKYYLNLYNSHAINLPFDFSILAYPISESWDMGNGKKYDIPETTNGVSWIYRDSKSMGTMWATSSINPDVYCSSSYGGTWYSGSVYECSQSFSTDFTDLRMDVTKIVNLWLTGLVNNGMLLKRDWAFENPSGSLYLNDSGNLTFFSQDTNTIYLPKLEVCWDDSIFITGSLSTILNDEVTVYFKNLKTDYRQLSKAKMRVAVRDIYPEKNYITSGSQYQQVKYLPSSSYYSIKDASTEDVVVPFDDIATKISCDNESNYFNVWFNGLQPERFYKFIIKTIVDDQEIYFDNNYLFKVKR